MLIVFGGIVMVRGNSPSTWGLGRCEVPLRPGLRPHLNHMQNVILNIGHEEFSP